MNYKDLIGLIKRRRSIRKFNKITIKFWNILQIIEAGIFAPSGSNVQAQRFVVTKDADIIKHIINTRTKDIATVNVLIFYYCDKTKCHYNIPKVSEVWGKLPYYDCGASVQNMLLTAESKKIKACWFVMDDNMKCVEYLNKKFEINKNRYEIMAMIALGYSDETVNYETDLHHGRPIKRKRIDEYILKILM